MHLRRPFQAGDLVGAYLAIDASDDPHAQRGAREEAGPRACPPQRGRCTHQCDWIAPALVKRGPLQIAISTSGESPFLARALRERVESMFGEEWGPFTALMGGCDAGSAVAAWGDAQHTRLPTPASLAHGRCSATARRARLRRAGIEQGARPGDSSPAGRGRPRRGGAREPDLSRGAREVLADADVVFHDALVAPRRSATVRPASTTRRCRQARRAAVGAQSSINEAMIAAARSATLWCGSRAATLSLRSRRRGGGRPAARRYPGASDPRVSAALAAPAAAGIP